MEVSVFALADYANVAEGGKLNVAGIFDRIWGPNFPLRHASMVVALRIRAEWEDSEKEKTIALQLEDEDGQKAFRLEGKFQVPKIEPGRWASINQVIGLRDVVFQRPGTYLFRILLNGKEVARSPLALVKAERPS